MTVPGVYRSGWRVVLRWAVISLFVVVAVTAAGGVANAEWLWPQDFSTKDGKLTVYQPQLEVFKADKVNARAAVAVQRKGEKEPVFGVFWFSARIVTDRESRTVEFRDVKTENLRFSSGATQEDKELAQSLASQMATRPTMSMSLDRFISMAAVVERDKPVSDKVRNDPPKILFTTTPSVLVIINGNPILRDVEGTQIQRVVNTPFIMLYDPASKTYYLKGGTLWYTASDIKGTWETVARPPAPIKAAARRVSQPEDPSVKQEAKTKPKVVPHVIVATEPTELIVADGEPHYAVIPGTDLLYMSNTDSDVFMDVKSHQYYVVLAGRWFRSSSLEGATWVYVPSQKLPATFYQISPASEKGHVLTYIADTRQAEEALVDAQIPQTAAVKKSEARLDVTYDGEPKFEPIQGTDVEYAVNTSSQVLRIKGKYYAVNQAVWFISDSPGGPWIVSDYRPSEVDSIPADSPVYNMKYVYVYDSTPEVTYTGYTPGYTGTYVDEGTVVYGTGYDYPGWAGTAYYPAPITWGGWPWWGWGGWWPNWWWGNWGWGGWWGNWGWGGWWWPSFFNVNVFIDRHGKHVSFHDGRGHGHNIYNHPGNRAWNAQTSMDRRFDRRSGGFGDSRSGRAPGGGREQGFSARSQGRGAPQSDRLQRGTGQPGVQAPARGPGDSASSQRSAGVRQGGADQQRRADRLGNNNVFAGRDGTIYRRTDRGWQQRDRGTWARPEGIDRSAFNRNRPALERDFYSRSRGFDGGRSFRGQSSGSSGFRSGGFSGGGSRGAPSGGSFRGGAPSGGGSRGGMSGGGSRGGMSGGGSGRGGR